MLDFNIEKIFELSVELPKEIKIAITLGIVTVFAAIAYIILGSNLAVITVKFLGIFSAEFKVKGELNEQLEEINEKVAEEFSSYNLKNKNLRLTDANISSRDAILQSWAALQDELKNAAQISQHASPADNSAKSLVQTLSKSSSLNFEKEYLIVQLVEFGQQLDANKDWAPMIRDAALYRHIVRYMNDWIKHKFAANEPRPHKRRKTVVGGNISKPDRSDLPALWLVGTIGPNKGQRYALNKNNLYMGANSNNEIVIKDDDYVSGNHAYLRYDAGTLLLIDQDSRNGSYVNGQKLHNTTAMVNPGDEIRIGNSTFELQS